jgi:flagellar motility protein MotE (MotC chaperone)
METLLSNESLSDFFVDIDNLSVLKEKLRVSLSGIRELKEKTKNIKMELEDKERNERGLKLIKEQEKRKTLSYKSEKEKLLNLNREEEKQYKKLIEEKKRIKNEIRTRIFRTVGGTEISFGDALALVQPYEEKIGVESALVLAVLFQESAVDGVIGRNLGKCTYNQKANNKSGTVMSNSQKQSFLAIIGELGMSPGKTPVSCPISRDGSYGGAMGPSQFMPNTWWDIRTGYGYKKRVAKVLGVETPSPFVNLDAFVGTMLYLSDARGMCAGPKGFSNTFEIWSCTAAKYYSGLQSRGSKLSRHMKSKYSYGYKVAKRAQAFQKDIDTLGM